MNKPFVTCSVCGATWVLRDQFLGDPDISLVGYQVSWDQLSLGLLLFNHAPCHGTLSVAALAFRDVYNGPIFRARATGTDDCPGHCLRPDDLEACHVPCECAWVREVIQRLRTWPKHVATR